MRLGIALPIDFGAEPAGLQAGGDIISEGARAAEANGFDSVWFFDSIGRGRMSLDPLMGAAVAASATERIEVGLGILQVPLRHPVELAQRVLTAQVVCGPRLLLGVGSGSTRADFEAVGKRFEDRMTLLRDGLATMKRLWDGETVDGANLSPSNAVRGGPSVLIGSWAGPRWIASAANEYDGWIASAFFSGYNTLKEGLDRYRAAGGKRAIITNISLDLNAPTEWLRDTENAYHLRCAPPDAAARLQRLADAGFDDAVVVYRGGAPADLAAIRALLP
ncbi:MAG: LLM class flavin-dependent oxidoreductase [Chloroflexota bacterium]|nr:LLM class flavin-dependent oxidoreductase [Chloroflexota bacterium]MDE2886543.1 LLM class flavin-dependent oxidoreductase [Chloroflexota bacterium]